MRWFVARTRAIFEGKVWTWRERTRLTWCVVLVRENPRTFDDSGQWNLRSGSYSTVSRSNCNLEMLVFFGGRKTGVPGEKPLGAETRTNNKLNPHMTPRPGIEPGPHWCEACALTTTPSLLPGSLQYTQLFATMPNPFKLFPLFFSY